MRIFAFSDLHLHSFREFATYAEGENSRLGEIAERLEEALARAVEEEVDCIVFPGDFYDNKNHIDVNALTYARNILMDFKDAANGNPIPVVMCSGTHDIGRNQRSTLISLEGVFRDLYIDRKTMIGDGLNDWDFLSVPAAVGGEDHPEKVHQYADGLRKDALARTILVTHGFVSGPHFNTPGGIEGGIPEDYLLNTFKLSILGHFHNPSQYTYYDKRTRRGILIPGAVIPHDFGNNTLGRSWVVDIDKDGDIQFESKVWDHPRFVSVDLSIDRPKFNKEDYYRILTRPGEEVDVPDEVRAIVVQRDEIEARVRVDGISVGDTPEQLVNKYVLYKADEDLDALPLLPPALSKIGRILVKSTDRELSDEDTEKLEEAFDDHHKG